MDSTIAAALISAAASVVVVLAGRLSGSDERAMGRILTLPPRNKKVWPAGLGLFVAWMVLAALFLPLNIAEDNALWTPIVVWVLCVFYPIRPSWAAGAALALFPFAFVTEPVSHWRRGLPTGGEVDPFTVGTFLALAFGTAFIAWLLATRRVRTLREEAERGRSALQPSREKEPRT